MIHQLRQNALSAVHRLLLIALVCASSTGTATANQQWQETLEGFVDGFVTTGLDQDAVAGAVVVIVSGDDVILSRGYRLSDVRTARSMSPEADIIPLASVTKVFTALAILQLEDNGRLSLDDPIARHLPRLQLNQRFGDVTIAHLLSHTAGLEERYSGYFAVHGEQGNTPAIEQISKILPRQIRPPEDVISYSNASYVLLGEIIAQVSGQPFEEYITDTILSPLGIDNARFMHEPSELRGTSPFHVWDTGRYVAIDPSPFHAIHLSSGGLALTAEAMGRIMQLLLAKGTGDETPALTSTSINKMYEPAWPDAAEFSGRALGYWTERWAGHTVYHHGGSHFGFHTNMVLVPSMDLGFFVAANGPSGSALTRLPRRVLREVIAPHERPVAARSDCDTACLRDFTGHYIPTRRNETGLDRLHALNSHRMDLQIADDDMLLLSGLDHSRLFQAIAEDQFETPEGDFRLGFRRDVSGGVIGAHFSGGIHTFDRTGFWHSAASLNSALWAALAGSLLCLAGAVITWRSKSHLTGMTCSLGLGWIVGVGIYMVVLVPLLNGRDLSSHASAGIGLWTLTCLYAAAVGTLVWSAAWLLRPLQSANAMRTERFVVFAAMPLFAWALLAAWIWNLPTAALTW
ncbi:serine hydrolase [uncultured Tateyamaria sp.]|uniref:serine hydrolase domain-containing protein n=1 Tax=uncultured Tateyamaria sp. TaxID=455651 RepID=UPI00261ACDB3|nr:serine hydrolase domain-containing protein [uncultured Tateyamaria sp.]